MKRFLVTKLAVISLFASVTIASAAGVEADAALKMLLDGNVGFAKSGDVTTLKANSTTTRRTALAAGQTPFAIVLTCSDSRVPPEILFDRGLGEIFVVRVAGNVVAPHELGSIEYGIEHLGANLVMVLGHSSCGAVKATYGAYPGHLDGNIGSLTEDIYPAVEKVVGTNPKPVDATAQATQVEECIVENLKGVAESLPEKSFIIEEYMRGKVEESGEYRKVKVIKAKYDLKTGVVAKIGTVELAH